MPRKLLYRAVSLACITLLGLFFSIPSYFKTYPGWLKPIFSDRRMRLGLDLQGGMQLILRVEVSKAVQNQLNLAVRDFTQALEENGITVESSEILGSDGVDLHFRSPAEAQAAETLLRRQFPNLLLVSWSVEESGPHLDIGLPPGQVPEIQEGAVSQSLEIIRNRIDQFGVTEPLVVRQGRDQIVLQLPGIRNPDRAITLVGKTAQLEFKLVDERNVDLSSLISAAIESGDLKPGYSHEDLNRALRGHIPPDDEVDLWRRVDPATGSITMEPILLKRKALMTGDVISTARVEIGGRFSTPRVTLSLNALGTRIFDRITAENVGRQLAIVLDNVVQSAPVIQDRISGGEAQITGGFTMDEAKDLAIVLRAGALPAPVDIVQNLTVGPSLGEDSIRKGVASAILGGILVISFMFVYYGLAGVIADQALILNLILLLAALSLFGATLTLPGIAGIILSIGMAVDSNVLIFERMREERAVGKPIFSAIDAGFDRAFWTIIDSHITTLITAFALFLFGTGPIKGFAVTLSLGVILNLFTVLFGTRVAYDYLRWRRRIKRLRFLQIIRNPHVDFIRLRRGAFAFSGALILLGLFAMVQTFRGKGDLGVDFTGGTVVQFKAERDFRMDDVRQAFVRNGLGDYELQEIPGKRTLIVRMKSPGRTAGHRAEELAAILERAFPENHFEIESQAAIGAPVSKDLRKSAVLAILISLAGILIYLAWRFNFHFGVSAAIATFHDVLVVLGVLFLLHREITLLVVTAFLTLAGYSLTDTVVVFDRIRENLRKKPKAGLKTLINESINEVLSRTLITSSTVFMVLVALLSFGGMVLHDFALALTIGVIIGTYSSVFVASPIIYVWPTKKDRKRKEQGAP
jgi:SecD/SecF fusion protein